MSHYIVKGEEGDYMYHRRSTGEMYTDRTAWGPNKSDARVFTQKNAALRAARDSVGYYTYRKEEDDLYKFEIVEVDLVEKV